MLSRLPRLALLLVVAASALAALAGYADSAQKVSASSRIPLTLGVDVPTGLSAAAPIKRFDALTGRRPQIVQESVSWKYLGKPTAAEFPTSGVSAAFHAAFIPEITWSPTIAGDASRNQPAMSLASIIRGGHDAYIRRFARAAASAVGPILLRFAPGMNAANNNFAELNSGNRKGQFVKAWRHVWSIFKAVGAKNVRWVWSPDVGANRRTLAGLYPGNDYVDWVGLAAYSDRADACAQLSALFAPSLRGVASFSSRPVMLSEVGASAACPNKPSVISRLFSWLETEPSVRSITWSESGPYAIDTDVEALAAFDVGVTQWDPSPASTNVSSGPPTGLEGAGTSADTPTKASPSAGLNPEPTTTPVASATTPATSPTSSPAPGAEVDTSDPSEVVGDGQPTSCTSAAVVTAVEAGGIITFNCGLKPLTISMTATADVPKTDTTVVLDGGGLITLSGEGERQILFSDTCQGTRSTADCVNQPYPQIVVQNLTLEDGYSGAEQDPSCTQSSAACWYGGVDGGGAIYAEGGQLKAVNDNFIDNSCYASGPDLGGGAIRALAQYDNQPVYITNDTFTGNSCSNGGALSSISVGWDITGSDFSDNSAIGFGANPAAQGTPGGGNGGAMYVDGVDDNVEITSTVMTGNMAAEGGGAVFDTVDSGYGALGFDHSQLTYNTSDKFQTAPGIYYLLDGEHATPTFTNSADQ